MSGCFRIPPAGEAEAYFCELRVFFLQEWGRLDPLHDERGAYPDPTVALTDTGALAGGLAFTRAIASDVHGSALWVNAVLVRPEYRRRGLARRLIGEAQSVCRARGWDRLYAFTHRPELYSGLGWIWVRDDGGRGGMMRVL